ncbi:MAG: 3-phosphoshikimate 1-carboxyvinyltransferase, partial [Eubacteriales bacterium]
PFSFTGRLQSGTFELPGNVSSQYITGLLLALPALDGDSEIRLTSPLQSASYVNITLHALSRFGIRTSVLPRGFLVPGGQTFQSPGTLVADGDWSNAGYFLAAGALGKDPVSVAGLSPDSPQGDRVLTGILKDRMGARVSKAREEDGTYTYTVTPAESLSACDLDVHDIPDAFPVLAVLAAFANGRTRFTGCERLRFKESDRVASVIAMLEALGGKAVEEGADIIVCGADETGGLTGGTVSSFGDHRIVMAAAVAALRCTGDVTITGAEAVRKSYPSFFEEYTALGGIVHVI